MHALTKVSDVQSPYTASATLTESIKAVALLQHRCL